jgi:translation initiation factor IF-3
VSVAGGVCQRPRAATPAAVPSLAGDAKIAKRRFIRREEEKGKSLRINERIRISPVRLIDQDNEQVGIVETDRAREMAREAGLDLVEVAPNVRPPVCRIMDYGKWKYQQRKKEQKAKSHAKQSELKEVRLRPGTDEHDMTIKMDRAREFLEEGHKVQFTMMFRGRQMAHKDIGFRNFEQIADSLQDIAKVEVAPRSMGRRMTMMVAPLARSERKTKAEQEKAKGETEAKPSEERPAPEPPPTHQSPNV